MSRWRHKHSGTEITVYDGSPSETSMERDALWQCIEPTIGIDYHTTRRDWQNAQARHDAATAAAVYPAGR